jgi:hypothetical protein
MRFGLLRSFVALLPSLTLAACVNVDGDFDRFANATNSLDLSVSAPDLPPSRIFDVSGRFFLAFSTALAPDKPAIFLLDSTLTQSPANDGTATLDLVFHQLSTPMEMMIGTPMPITAPVASDGTFTLIMNNFPILAAGNPVTGSDLIVDVHLIGTIRSANRFCGDVTGMVTSPAPIDLTGSTWGAIRVPDGAIGSSLPPWDYSCPAGEPDGGAPDGG